MKKRTKLIEIDGWNYRLPSAVVNEIHKLRNEAIVSMITKKWIRLFQKNFDNLFPCPDVWMTTTEMDRKNGWRL
jgi:hypothetical protein